ncbi:MAG: GNAT family N-acetyltransferase [Planctomycetaceae bacterium]|nr:GNAT family N-acetyltransferase [Planctomycetaceae bacterium]
MVTLALGDGRSTAAPVRRPAEFWVECCDSADVAESLRAAWDDLAWHAIESNPFYESWMLLPAWRALAGSQHIRLACVYRNGARPQDPPELCGLVPLVRERYGGWPVDAWSSWQHPYCYLCTPLLRQGVAVEALRALWTWMQSEPGGPALWELPHIDGGGLFQQALIEVANERAAALHVAHQYNRAMLAPAETAEAYCAATMTCHNRQELRRQRRRFNDRGHVEVRTSTPGERIEPWIEHFLSLEAAGWKGLEQTAFAAAEADAAYFRAIVTAAAERNQAVFLGLFLDDRPVALKVNFLAGDGGFAFKIAFDESFAKFSPGVQLELENIDWVHRQCGLKWMDSCAKPGHFMIGRLWRERRTIQRVVVSTGSWRGNLMLGLLPFARAVKSLVKPKKDASP